MLQVKISAVKIEERKCQDNQKWKDYWTEQQLAAATQKERLSESPRKKPANAHRRMSVQNTSGFHSVNTCTLWSK